MAKAEAPIPLSDFDYALPEELIAQTPPKVRGESRLLVFKGQTLVDSRFERLAEHLRTGDLLVTNNTLVLPARISTQKPTGGKVELLLVRPYGEGPLEAASSWWAMGRPLKSLKPGVELRAPMGETLKVHERRGELVRISAERALVSLAAEQGELPLPPYIQRAQTPADRDRYQSIWAKHVGSSAAPTASLHFTDDLLAKLDAKGIQRVELTLHVGPGTFLPVRESEDVRRHEMHAEWYSIPPETLSAIKKTRAEGGRVIGVGTTACRAVESYAASDRTEGLTDIFIYPGYSWRLVDGMVTNFHLPKSTLLMMVSALIGRDPVMRGYRHAIEKGYRFFSYGDACLLLPQEEQA